MCVCRLVSVRGEMRWLAWDSECCWGCHWLRALTPTCWSLEPNPCSKCIYAVVLGVSWASKSVRFQLHISQGELAHGQVEQKLSLGLGDALPVSLQGSRAAHRWARVLEGLNFITTAAAFHILVIWEASWNYKLFSYCFLSIQMVFVWELPQNFFSMFPSEIFSLMFWCGFFYYYYYMNPFGQVYL